MIYSDIDTPSILVDLNIVDNNIEKFQTYCNSLDLALRPHIKTHKIPELAKRQLEAGAVGITCQKISEAEAMISEGGITDILITFNIIGSTKLTRLRALSEKVVLSVVADNSNCVIGLSKAFSTSPKPLTVLVECDTGALRCGVVTPQEANKLACLISDLPGLRFGGLMTYPPIAKYKDVNDFLESSKVLIEGNGMKVDVVSIGGSPDMWYASQIPIATEYRIGTYVYNDRSLVVRGTCTLDDCALTVLATVISTPSEKRAVIDAGSKVFTSDLLDLQGYGHVIDFADLSLEKLSEEHGCLTSDSATGLTVGQKIRIVPNHACVVSNMLDQVVLVRGPNKIKKQSVVGRGQVW